jgi:hypothetical protein
MLAATTLALIYFTMVLLFTSSADAIRAAAMMTLFPLITGLIIVAGGLFVRRAGYFLLGLSLVIFGVANLSFELRSQSAWWWHLWFALLIMSDLVCLVSLAIQWKEKDFTAPS